MFTKIEAASALRIKLIVLYKTTMVNKDGLAVLNRDLGPSKSNDKLLSRFIIAQENVRACAGLSQELDTLIFRLVVQLDAFRSTFNSSSA